MTRNEGIGGLVGTWLAHDDEFCTPTETPESRAHLRECLLAVGITPAEADVAIRELLKNPSWRG